MEYWLNGIISVIVNLFELYVISRFMRCFFDTVKTRKSILLLVYLFRYIIWLVIERIANYPIINLMTAFLCIFLIASCYRATISKRLLVSLIIIICLLMAESIVGIAIGFAGFELFEESRSLANFYDFMIVVLFWVMALITRRFRNIKTDIRVPVQFSGAVFFIVMISLFMEAMFFAQKDLNYKIVAPFLLCIVLLNVIIIYLYDTLSKSLQDRIQLKLMEKERESYHNQFEVMQRNYEEMRNFRHDCINRFMAMERMLNDNRLEELRQYICDVIGTLDSQNVYCDSGNVAIDSILNYLLTKAVKAGISVETDIQIPDELVVMEDDMIVVFGNLLNNAIEANMDESIKGKKLMISVRFDKGCMKICVRNTHANKVQQKGGHLLTSKSDKSSHGIGLRSVDAIVEKYGGIKTVKYDEKEFQVEIVMKIQ